MSLEVDLSGQTAIVTGVSSGIGAGVAKMLAKAGAAVAGCSRSLDHSKEVQGLAAEIEGIGGTFYYKQVDVTKNDQLQSFVDYTVSHCGSIDILVSNAGANIFEKALHCGSERWQYNIDLNLQSHWMMGKLCHPYLKKSSNGIILIMSSNHAVATIPGCFPYNVTKTSLTGLVRSLAIEWGPDIRTIGLAPGFIETNGNEDWFRSFSDPQAERTRTIQLHPVGRLGTVEEVGGFCAFLSSSYAAFATGVTYVIDGGRTALLQDM
ncbi:SDR family NAD(P)-dependent oxidoreductase [Salibacterium aidingense]|uniref:SDR family NAD(P)-dependent oxidoreductase n=1 Tax=Salibacterium aidingense TaxID=384933 RepID=UPI00040CC592|nr:SDR family oxidoreductase [Salibacterium aidingense]